MSLVPPIDWTGMAYNLSITLNIDSTTSPKLATAVTDLLTALHSAGHLEGIQIDSGLGYDETDFVVFEDMVEYLRAQGLKDPRQKAERVWWNLNYKKFQSLNPHILMVCNNCLKPTKECPCSYSVKRDRGVKIGVQSLLDPQRILCTSLSPVSEKRLRGFIEMLRASRRDFPRTP